MIKYKHFCFQIQSTGTLAFQNLFEKSDPESEIADFIFAKGYLPNEKDLPKPLVTKNNGKHKQFSLH